MGYRRLVTLMSAIALGAGGCSSGSGGSPSTSGATTTVAVSVVDGPVVSPAGTLGEPTKVGTVIEVAETHPELGTFRAAVRAAGWDRILGNPGPYTLFAPTDEAFVAALDQLGMTADELFADTALVSRIVAYHVLAGRLPSSTVFTLNAQRVPTMNGGTVAIDVENNRLFINSADVVEYDIRASNGLIHAIDEVLLPPADGDAASSTSPASVAVQPPTTSAAAEAFVGSDADRPGNLIEVAHWNDDLSMFVQATGSADLFVTLANDGPFTLLVPTNAAFAAALTQLGMTADEFFADAELVTRILNYHVVTGSYPMADVRSLAGAGLPSLSGAPVPVVVDGDAVRVDGAAVIAGDLMARNGIIHVIDRVLIPS